MQRAAHLPHRVWATCKVRQAARRLARVGPAQHRSYTHPSGPRWATLTKEPVTLGAPPPPPVPTDPSTPAPPAHTLSVPPTPSLSPYPSSADSSTPDQVTVSHHQDLSLTIHAPQHGLENARFAYAWLRDSDSSPLSVDPSTRQKVHRSSDVPDDIFPLDTKLVKLPDSQGMALRIVWSAPLLSAQSAVAEIASGVAAYEPAVGTYPFNLLKQYASPSGWDARHRSDVLRPALWSRTDLEADARPLHVPYSDFLVSDEVRYRTLRQLVQRGLVFFDGVPNAKKSGWQTELKTLVEGMGELRRTFYGDLWDVRSDGKDAVNVAYTNQPLDLHADLVHFQNPPRFQLLHCLRNRVSGGRSAFVDAFRTASLLLASDPAAFALLCTHPIPFEYVHPSSGHHTSWARATIELRPGWTPQDVVERPEDLPAALFAVNYAPPFQGPLLTHPPSGPSNKRAEPYPVRTQTDVRRALRKFAALMEAGEERWETRLEEGQCVAFDNRRVMHARTAFEDIEGEAGEVDSTEEDPKWKRWLKGAYVEGDSVWDRLRVLDLKYGPR